MTDASNTNSGDLGVVGLVTISRFHGIAADPAQLRHRCGFGPTGGRLSTSDLLLCAKHLGLQAKQVTLDPRRYRNAPLPALILDNQSRHFVLAQLAANGEALIQEGDELAPRVIPLEEVHLRSGSRAILFTSRAALSGELLQFDFSWFIPIIVRYRRILLEILGMSAVLQLIGLVWPLIFQVVMDKVLVNQSFSTLNIVCCALVLVSISECVLTALRNFILAHSTSRMDVELGAKLFRHLLSLPLGYFAARRVGDTVSRIRELENIRSFLTGQTLTALIDMAFSAVYIVVMCLYSVPLTLIVIGSLPLYALTSGFLNPAFRKRLNSKFRRGADSHSMLVESISGIETIKTMAVEPQFTKSWDQTLSAYVTASFSVTTLSNVGQQLVQGIGKLVSVLTLFWGARYVIQGSLSVGELIAFNMMSQRVAGPVLRLAQLWQDFQQVGLSMQRLADILNTRTELQSSKVVPPAIIGRVEFEDVFFRYRPDAPEVLRGITFTIEPSQVVGIVGRSGSGKSTLTKLLQKLYLPHRGRISVDGHDLTLCDPEWLRRQIGVVAQDNVLFSRSVRDNIALSDPGTPLERVIEVARLAGIHDSIVRLPEGYDTRIGENGAGLSGGQKQRIAIARALLSNPRILVFDEATSALDYETERVIQDNMRQICAGRTVIIIAHRLTAVRNADRILAMDHGQVVEMGAHDELLARRGYYADLVALQSQGA